MIVAEVVVKEVFVSLGHVKPALEYLNGFCRIVELLVDDAEIQVRLMNAMVLPYNIQLQV
jgi:hypothetical protein